MGDVQPSMAPIKSPMGRGELRGEYTVVVYTNGVDLFPNMKIPEKLTYREMIQVFRDAADQLERADAQGRMDLDQPKRKDRG